MKRIVLLFCFLSINLYLFGQNYPMDGSPITDCSGFFMDSGGGNNDYGANENFTTTICSDMSTGTHIQLVFSGVELSAGDELCFFDGTDATAPSLMCASDFDPGAPFIVQATAANVSGCLTLTFNSDASDQGAGWSADINCIPACQLIQATLVSTDPVVSPPDTGYIDICPGDRVFLEAAGMYPQNGVVYQHSDLTSSFSWDFGDGNTAVGPNTSHVYENPGGYIIQLTIEDQFGCKNTNFISQRVRVSTYPDFELAGDIPDEICSGDTLELIALVSQIDSAYEVSVTPTEGTFQTTGVLSDSLPLPDGTGATYTTSIMFSDFAPGQVLTNINDLLGICVNMEHSWLFDLEIFLTCPDGTTVILQNQEFIGNETFLGEPYELDDFNTPFPPGQGIGWDYCWTPGSTNGTWTEYVQANDPQTLPSQDYESFEPLTNFLGCPLNGEWTITVQDLWGSDNGWIFEWSIGFDPSLYPNVETFTPQIVDYAWTNNPSIISYTTDSILVSPANAGTPSYNFAITDNFGCTYDTTILVNVLPPTHPDCYDCADILPALQDTSICEGNALTIGISGTPLDEQEITFEAFANQEFDANTFPPGNPFASAIVVNSINPDPLTDALSQIASVCVNIEHTFDADVEIRLMAPNGTLLELSSDNGGGGDGYLNTCFTPDAVTPITAGTAPFTGDYQPEGNWADLNGNSINGTWTLLVSDDLNGFGGTLLDWSITFVNTNEITYLWSPAAELSCDDCPDPIATPTSTTDFVLNITDSFTCTDSDTLSVEVFSAYPAPDLDCGPQLNGELTITWDPVAGATDYEISLDGGLTWIMANGPLSHTVNSLTMNDVVDIMVRVVSNNINCPSDIATIQCVYIGCAFSIDTTATFNPTCWNTADGSVLMEAMGGQAPVMYTLDGGPMSGANISGVAAGNHVVVATDGAGCTDTISFLLTAPDTIFLTVAADSVSCFGDCDGQAIVLATGGTGPFNYAWNTVPAVFNEQVNNLCLGNYSVTATDTNGCSSTLSTDIESPEFLTANIAETAVSCNSSNDGEALVIPSGGTGPYTYLWSDPLGQFGNPAILLEAGMYTVTITDAKGCTIENTVEITEPDTLTINLGQTAVACFGGNDGTATAIPQGGTLPYTYLWNDLATQTTATANNLTAGNYIVEVTDGNGCTAQASILVGQPASALNTAVLQTYLGCDGAMGNTAEVIANGGTGPYAYEWSSGAITANASDLDETAYLVTVTDANGCSVVDAINITELEPITANLVSVEPTCFNDTDGQISINSISGGTGMGDPLNYNYSWNTNPTQNTATISSLSGSMNYEVTITDSQGCSAVESLFLQEPSQIILTLDADNATCFGFSDGEATVIDIQGDNSNYTYNWGANTGNQTTPTATNLPSGIYEITVTDDDGCTGFAQVEVMESASMQLVFAAVDNECSGFGEGALTAIVSGGTPGYTYTWGNGASTENIDSLTSGVYPITITDANGCMLVDSGFVAGPPPLEADITIEDVSCFGERDGTLFIDLTGGSPPYLFSLDNEEFNGSNLLVGLTAGDYDIFIIDGNGCEWQTSASINSPAEFSVDAGPSMVEIILGDSIQLIPSQSNGQGSVEYTWIAPYDSTLVCPPTNPDCDRPWSITQNTIIYEVYGVDDNGCEDRDMITVRVIKERQVDVPTGFSPNGDNINDLLLVHGKEGIKIKMFRVFDRWGNLIFEAEDFMVNDPLVGWDGTFRNEEMNPGVFIWYVEAEFIDRHTQLFKGNTTLLR